MRHLALLALLLPLPAAAEMTAEEFDSYTRGKTLTYAQGGAPYGAEAYLEGRRVRWSFLDGRCKEGYWYPAEASICFVYEDNPTPQCWSFDRRPQGLVARFENDPAQITLYEADESSKPMLCLGPEIGV